MLLRHLFYLLFTVISLSLFTACGGDGKSGKRQGQSFVVHIPQSQTVGSQAPEVNVTTARGSDHNGSTGGGTQTAAIKSLKLEIATTTLNKDHNTTVTLKATYDDNTTKTPNNIEWLINPKDAVRIKGNTLTALKDTNVTIQAKVGNTLSNKVHLNIYWEVNGHRLPPEPDPKINNATLLGVDVNHNGVRDDVERYILKTYGKEKITIEIGFQVARAYNTVIKNPEKAMEVDKVITAAQDCASYFETFANFFGDPILLKNTDIVTSKKFKSIQLNTAPRIRAYLEYNRNLSGQVFTSTQIDKQKEQCAFDVDKLLKERKAKK